MGKDFLTVIDYVSIIRKNLKKLFIIVFITGIVSVGVSLLLPKYYKSTAVILVPQSGQVSIANLGMLSNLGLGSFGGMQGDISRIVAILKSRSVLESVASKFKLQKKYGTKTWEATLKKLRKNIEITIGEEFQIYISVFDKDRFLVDDMTNYVVYCLDSINISLTSKSAHDNRIFIESRLDEVLDSMEVYEKRMSNFMRKHGILSLPDQIRVGVEKAADLKAQLTMLEIEIEVAKNKYGENSPLVEQLKFQLESMRNKYNEFRDSKGRGRLFPNFSDVPEMVLTMARLEREIEYYSKLIEFLGPQYEQAKIEEKRKTSTIQILDWGKTPERKAKPKRMLIVLISVLTVTILSVTFFIVRESIRG